jgi:hypothetical protein
LTPQKCWDFNAILIWIHTLFGLWFKLRLSLLAGGMPPSSHRLFSRVPGLTGHSIDQRVDPES